MKQSVPKPADPNAAIDKLLSSLIAAFEYQMKDIHDDEDGSRRYKYHIDRTLDSLIIRANRVLKCKIELPASMK